MTFLLIVSAVLLAPSAEAAPASSTTVDHLVRQLGNDSFLEREKASSTLETIGEPALDALRRAAGKSEDAEVRRGAAALVRAIEGRWELPILVGHNSPVSSITFSPDGQSLLSIGWDGTSVYDMRTGKQFRIPGRSGRRFMNSMASLSCNGKMALSASARGLCLWEIETGKEVQRFRCGNSGVSASAISPDGRSAVSASEGGTVRLWDLENGEELRQMSALTNVVTGVGFSPDGRHIIASGKGGVTMCDVQTGKVLGSFKSGEATIARAARFSPDGRRVVAVTQSAIHEWEAGTGKELRHVTGCEGWFPLAISTDGRRLVSAGADNAVRLWDVTTGKELRRYRGHARNVTCVAVSADGLAASGSADGAIKVWRLPK